MLAYFSETVVKKLSAVVMVWAERKPTQRKMCMQKKEYKYLEKFMIPVKQKALFPSILLNKAMALGKKKRLSRKLFI